jgi:hypothetical protein
MLFYETQETTLHESHETALPRPLGALERVGLPAIIRPSFTLGGEGGGIATARIGIDPNGQETQQTMPWRPLGRMDDEELAVVYEYLTRLPGF